MVWPWAEKKHRGIPHPLGQSLFVIFLGLTLSGFDQESLWLSEQGAFQDRYLLPLWGIRPLSGPMKNSQNMPEEAVFLQVMVAQRLTPV